MPAFTAAVGKAIAEVAKVTTLRATRVSLIIKSSRTSKPARPALISTVVQPPTNNAGDRGFVLNALLMVDSRSKCNTPKHLRDIGKRHEQGESVAFLTP